MPKTAPWPWIIDGHPELWVRPTAFARVVNRNPRTVYNWLKEGTTLSEFGYETYQDVFGSWFIRISEMELMAIKRRKKSIEKRVSSDPFSPV